MLSLPSGVNRSVQAHNIDVPVFLDWLEANVLFSEEEVSDTDIVDFLIEQQIYEKQDFCSQFVSGAWSLSRRRLSWLRENSPIAFEGRFMQRKHKWQELPALPFCVTLALGPKYAGWGQQFGHDYTRQGALFEVLTCEALRQVFPGWAFTVTGWSRDNTSKLEDVVCNLADQLKEKVGDVKAYASGKAHEAGLDLVWHLPFSDDRGGLPVYLGQCSSGYDWPDKLHTPELNVWKKLIDFASEPYKAFSLPMALAGC